MKDRAALPKPPWIRVRPPRGESVDRVRRLLRKGSLHTVCEEARCPNLAECWGCGTATFLILGDVCTRRCAFCAVESGRPGKAHTREPHEVAEAASAMELRHAVITSVTRDDLDDGGAAVFASVIDAIRSRIPGCTVEVLIPDFQGLRDALARVVAAGPEILAHNLETVARLYPVVRPQADYDRSLQVLRHAKAMDPRIVTKSGIMLGLGEEANEIHRVMEDLRAVACDILTLGQYLCPSARHLPVQRYYTPDEFETFGSTAEAMGFRWVESAPLVRSSYHAAQQAAGLKRG